MKKLYIILLISIIFGSKVNANPLPVLCTYNAGSLSLEYYFEQHPGNPNHVIVTIDNSKKFLLDRIKKNVYGIWVFEGNIDHTDDSKHKLIWTYDSKKDIGTFKTLVNEKMMMEQDDLKCHNKF